MVEALKTSQFWTLYFLHFCACVVLTLILVHLVPFLTDIGFSRMIAASALGLVGGSSIIGRLGMGSVSDRIGRKNALTICFIIQAIVIISLMSIRSIWMIFAFAVIFGFSYGGWVPQFPAITVELFGTRSLSTILGLTLSSYGFGGTIGPTLGGYVFDMTGNYFIALSLSVFLCGLSALLSFLIKPLSLKTS